MATRSSFGFLLDRLNDLLDEYRKRQEFDGMVVIEDTIDKVDGWTKGLIGDERKEAFARIQDYLRHAKLDTENEEEKFAIERCYALIYVWGENLVGYGPNWCASDR